MPVSFRAAVTGFNDPVNGTPTPSQTSGDCKENQCNGSGAVVIAAKPSDLPNDNNECTSDTCNGTTPTFTPTAPRTACTVSGKTLCNGAGVCVACTLPLDCGSDTFCSARTCSVAGACGVSNKAAGTPTPTGQTAGDCHQIQCDNAGGTTNAIDNTDPFNDGNDCTDDLCTNGTPTNPNKPNNAACATNGNTKCNGAGVCDH